MRTELIGLSLAALVMSACTTPGKRTAMGAGAGAAGGAAAGAAIGAATGNAGKGAWIGAAAGGNLTLNAACGTKTNSTAVLVGVAALP